MSTGSINMRERLTELRETFKFANLFKDMIKKNTDEQPNEQIHRTNSGRLANAGASTPSWGTSPSWYVDVFPNLVCRYALNIGILWRLPHVGVHDQLLTLFLAPFPYLENGGLGWN